MRYKISHLVAILLLFSFYEPSFSQEFFEDGIYQIKLAGVRGERTYDMSEGVLAMHNYYERDFRDTGSCYAHVRIPSDPSDYGNKWKISKNEDGTYNISLYDKGDGDQYSGGLLCLHKVYDRDKRTENTTYAHVRKPNDSHNECTTWYITKREDADGYQIKVNDKAERWFQGSDEGRLCVHYTDDYPDHRDSTSVYAHVRSSKSQYQNNTTWKFVLTNAEELIKSRDEKIASFEALNLLCDQEKNELAIKEEQLKHSIATIAGSMLTGGAYMVLQNNEFVPDMKYALASVCSDTTVVCTAILCGTAISCTRSFCGVADKAVEVVDQRMEQVIGAFDQRAAQIIRVVDGRLEQLVGITDARAKQIISLVEEAVGVIDRRAEQFIRVIENGNEQFIKLTHKQSNKLIRVVDGKLDKVIDLGDRLGNRAVSAADKRAGQLCGAAECVAVAGASYLFPPAGIAYGCARLIQMAFGK